MTDFRFVPVRPRRWCGRYARIPGKTTALHVRLLDGRWWPSVEWVIGDEVAQCPIADVDNAEGLADAVNAGKRLLGGSPGGAFLVNEYGQVLVSSPSGDGNVALVGECAGPMAFHDSFASADLFDLTHDQGLTLGDAWSLPYLGIPHNLSKTSELYFWHERQDGGRKATPPVQEPFSDRCTQDAQTPRTNSLCGHLRRADFDEGTGRELEESEMGATVRGPHRLQTLVSKGDLIWLALIRSTQATAPSL